MTSGEQTRPGNRRFATTRWSLVLSAAGGGEERRAALSELMELYWYPLYAFARRKGEDRHAAEDLTQGFLASLIEREDLSLADRERGRFRAFLQAAMRNFMSTEWRKQRTLKRGEAREAVSLDVDLAEERLRRAAGTLTPEQEFDRDWALALLDTVVRRLRDEYADRGRAEHFDTLKPYLMGEGGAPYADTAAALGTSEGSVKVAVHRLRSRFREELRREVGETVDGSHAVEDELQALFDALRT